MMSRPTLPMAAASLTAVAALVAFVVWQPRRVVVEGASMAPTLMAGDRLLVRRARPVTVGDVVVVADPRGGRVIVKRVSAVLGDDIVVRGDNPMASTDSRHFGPVSRKTLVGTVVRCYAPATRAGPVAHGGPS